MKNLKRVLSLALSTAMVLGMMIVGSGATFADVKASHNDEAIAWVEVLGIMEGDENGNFNPDKVVSRNEMAVVMANLAGLKLNGTHPFSDVPAWADKYVAALYTNGLTSGTSATTYGGSGDVTTAQAALMIMKTLGYFEFQGEFGDDWQLATVKKASELRLFKDVDAGISEGLTRNELAQMIYNSLWKTVVVTREEGGMSVEGNGITVNQKPTYKWNGTGESLFDKLFDKDVTYTWNPDALGRPGWEIKYEKNTAVITEEAEYVLYVTDDEITTVEELLDDEKLDLDSAKNYEYDEDGEVIDWEYVEDFQDTVALGDCVEIFMNEDDEVTKVLVYSFVAVQIEEIEECDEDADEAWIEEGAKYIVTIDGEEYYDIQIAGFDAKTFEKDAWIVAPVDEAGNFAEDEEGLEIDKEDKSVFYGFEIAETVTDEVQTLKSEKTKIRLADGEQYEALECAAEALEKIAAGDKWTLVLAPNGYVVGGEVVEAEGTTLDEVYVWAESYTVAGKYADDTYAVLVDMNGEVTEVKYTSEVDEDQVAGDKGDLVVIDKNADKKTVLLVWDNLDDLATEDETEGDYVMFTDVIESLKKDSKRVDTEDGVKRLNADTQYIMIGGEAEDLEVSVKTGGIKMSTVTNSIVITEEGEDEVLYVIIIDTEEVKEDAKAEDMIFVAKVSKEESKDYFVNAVIFEDGTKKDIKFAKNETIEAGCWYEYEIDEDGYYVVYDLAATAYFDTTKVEDGVWGEDNEGVIVDASIVDLYNDLLTIAVTVDEEEIEVADINVEGAKFVDAHDKDADGQYTKTISSLTKLVSMLEKDEPVIENALLQIVVEEDGATLIILTSVDAVVAE